MLREMLMMKKFKTSMLYVKYSAQYSEISLKYTYMWVLIISL